MLPQPVSRALRHALQTRLESIALGSSAKQQRRPGRAVADRSLADAFDEFDADDMLDDPSATALVDDADEFDSELDNDGDIPGSAPRRAAPQRQRARPAKAARAPRTSKPRRAALSDEELDPADEWEPPERDRDRDRKRVEVSEPFKCRHCRAFVGIPPTGGRNRNHCPLCLYSLHVDGKTPGDRASDCHSSMAPIGTFYRPNLEQVVVHRCLGCG